MIRRYMYDKAFACDLIYNHIYVFIILAARDSPLWRPFQAGHQDTARAYRQRWITRHPPEYQ
jgi:hypothetical protein